MTTLTPAAQRDIAHHLHSYTQLRQFEREGPLVIVRGDGVHVIDEHGKRSTVGAAGAGFGQGQELRIGAGAIGHGCMTGEGAAVA